jgi:hypothetical protein
MVASIQISAHPITGAVAERNRVAGGKIRHHTVGGAGVKGNCVAVNEPERWINKVDRVYHVDAIGLAVFRQ